MTNGGIIGPKNNIVQYRTSGVYSLSEQYAASKSGGWEKPIVRDGLVLWLDASHPNSYPGSGTTWFDLSGGGNNFQLYNNPTFTSGTFLFNGSNQYARSINNLNLSSYSSVTVEIDLRIVNANIGMSWEHTADWNSNSGGIGLYPFSEGGAYVLDRHHTSHNGGIGSRNYVASVGSSWNTHTNIFSRISDSTGRLAYTNAALRSFSNGGTSTTGGSFANAVFYVASRAGTGAFGNHQVGGIRIYGKKLSATEVQQNFDSIRGRYGI